jgi:hypothetical protein
LDTRHGWGEMRARFVRDEGDMCVRFIRRRDRERVRCASGLYGEGIERERDVRPVYTEQG